MSVIYIMIPIAFLIAGAAVAAFIWAARQGQYDDLDTPALRVVQDDDVGAGAVRQREAALSAADNGQAGA